MKHLFFVSLLFLTGINSFAQFNDTIELNTYIRDTISDRRPEKITAAQLRKGLLGIVKFISLTTPLNNMQVGYGSNNNILTSKSTFTFNDTTNTLYADTLLSKRINVINTIGGTEYTRINYNTLNIVHNAGSDNVINLTTNSNSFKRIAVTNTHPGVSAGAGSLYINDLGSILQYYVGSSSNAYVPNGTLFRTNAAGGFNIVADAGPIAFGKSATMGASEFARFTTNGRFGIGTQTPLQMLHVAGQVKIDTITTGSSTDSVLTTSNGLIQKVASNSLNAYIFSTGLTNNTGTVTTNLSTGVTGGQTVVGGTASGDSLRLSSTSNSTKGKILFGTSVYNEVNNRLGLGTNNPQRQLDLTGSIALPTTTGTDGAIYLANARFLHAYTSNGVDPSVAGSNTFLGKSSGNFTMSGTSFSGALYNTGIGSSALTALSSGVNNTSVGASSSRAISAGQNNVAVGSSALYAATTASENVAIGTFSMLNGTGSNNVAAGSNSLSNVIGSNNTGIGYNSAINLSSGQFNIILGANVNVPVNTGSAQLNIGNVLYGTGLYSSASNSSTPTTSGKIGIGLTTPTAVLHLKAGTTSANTAPLKFSIGSNLTTPEDGAMEYNGAHLYLTIGSTRYQLDQQVNGDLTGSGIKMRLNVVSDANMTVGANDYTIMYTTATTSRTITLPSAGSNTYRILVLVNNTTNTPGTNDINLSTAIKTSPSSSISVIGGGERYAIQSDGADWWVIGR